MIAPPSSTRRTGLTFIEVVIATAMLVLLTSIVVGAITFMDNAAARLRYRADGMEVAHRIIVQHIDDEDLVPPRNKLIQHGTSYYRFTLDEEVIDQSEGESKGLRRATARRMNEMMGEDALRQMLNRVTVTVYLDDPENPAINTRVPVAQLTRLYNPVAGSRDQDASLRYIMKFVEQIQREQGGVK